jgi:hypothetical protein
MQLEWQAMSKIDLNRRWLATALLAGAATGSIASGANTVDVWVDLTERSPGPDAATSAAARQRDRVASQQQRVGEALSRMGGIELARIHATGNSIAVRIDRSRLDEVRAIPGVKRVRPARRLHPPRTGGPTQS